VSKKTDGGIEMLSGGESRLVSREFEGGAKTQPHLTLSTNMTDTTNHDTIRLAIQKCTILKESVVSYHLYPYFIV